MSKIAVIVPIYNAEPYLSECIASITAQSYADLVIILVNDASTDKSLDIAKSFAQNDERIIIIDKENSGVSATRNAALNILYSACDDKQNSSLGGGCIYFILKETKTNLNEFKIQFTNQPLNSNEWKLFTKTQNPLQATKNVKFVAFVDSDDIINPHAYERVVVPMQEDESVDCVIFGAKAFGEVSQEELERINKYHKIKRNGKVEMNESIVVETDNSSATKLFRLNLLQRHKIYFPPTKIGEDEVFKSNYLPLCKNVYFIDEIFYLYRQRKDSAMSVFRWNLTNSVVNIDILYNFKYIADFYQKNGLFDEKFNLLCKIYVSLVKSVLSMNARKNSKEILDIALNFRQKYFTNIISLNHQLRQKFKFGNDILGHSKEILCIELLGETISTKRRRYFLHFFKRKFKIYTTIDTSNNKISYIKFGRTKLITRKKGI